MWCCNQDPCTRNTMFQVVVLWIPELGSYHLYHLWAGESCKPGKKLPYLTLCTMVYLINMQHVLLIFWKNQACMVLLHPACFINFGKNSSLHGLLHPISSENHHSSHYFASKLTLMVKNWMECSLKTYSFNHMMSQKQIL